MINISADNRVLIVGKTGSGKTYLSKKLLRQFPRVLYFDALHRLDMPMTSLKDAKKITSSELETWHICLDNDEDYAEVVYDNFSDGGFICYIDELYSLASPQRKTGAGHELVNMLWTRGRGNGIGTWGATQRPTWIPLVALSESEHYFIMRLQLETDRKRIAQIVGSKAERVIKDKHGFWYANTSEDQLTYYKQLGVK